MASLYAQYLRERTEDKIIETEHGFITYRYLKDGIVYVIDIFVLPQFRMKKIGSLLADKVCEEAKKHGCTEVIGTVNPSCKNSHSSMAALLAYGMILKSSLDNVIIFKKDL